MQRGAPKKITGLDLQFAKQWYAEGFPLSAIALKLKVNKQTVSRRLKEEGVRVRPDIAKKVHSLSDRDRQIAAAYQKGTALATIARAHGISRQRVFQIATKLYRRNAID